MVCMVCATPPLNAIPIPSNDELAVVARQIIEGIVLTVKPPSAEACKEFRRSLPPKPAPRLGICIVERCARMAEAPCAACHRDDCARCTMAAELRSNEDRINAERDAELELIGPTITDEDIETIIEKMVATCCAKHAVLGDAILREWYVHRAFVGGAMPTVTSGPVVSIG